MTGDVHRVGAWRWNLLLVVGLVSGSARATQAGPTYLALGDSITFGVGIDDTASDISDGVRGYVGSYANYLGQTSGTQPKVINLAVSGETTASFSGKGVSLDGSDASARNTNYVGTNRPTQFALMNSTIAAEQLIGNTISTVTLSIGANDLFEALRDGKSITDTLATFRTNEIAILTQIRMALPSTNLIVLGYYDPYAPFINGDPSNQLTQIAQVAAFAIPILNSIIAEQASVFGARYVDLSPIFKGRETTETYILMGNVHPTLEGYGLITTAVEGVPEPASVLMVAIGLGLLPVLGRWQRTKGTRGDQSIATF